LILFIAASLYYLRDIVLIILTAIVLASAVEPGTQWFIRRGLPRIGAVIIIFVIMLTLIAGFFYLILPYVLTELLNFMHMLPQYASSLQDSNNYSLGGY
jgi:predicted PurR-regulated permease PerM